MENRVVRTAKEVARHLLHRAGLRPAPPHLAHASRAARFGEIYDRGVWKMGEDLPASGRGSSLAATETLRAELAPLLDRLGSERLLDIGCGDFTWMAVTPLAQHYIGVDIVASVIEANRSAFAGPTREFHLLDAIEAPLPAADTILCREVLFHLSLADGRRLIANMLATPRRFLIATTDGATRFNADIATGDFRPLNLEAEPFRLPPPVDVIDDGAVAGARRMGVWSAAQLAHLAR